MEIFETSVRYAELYFLAGPRTFSSKTVKVAMHVLYSTYDIFKMNQWTHWSLALLHTLGLVLNVGIYHYTRIFFSELRRVTNWSFSQISFTFCTQDNRCLNIFQPGSRYKKYTFIIVQVCTFKKDTYYNIKWSISCWPVTTTVISYSKLSIQDYQLPKAKLLWKTGYERVWNKSFNIVWPNDNLSSQTK
jgi:hypothetical protein